MFLTHYDPMAEVFGRHFQGAHAASRFSPPVDIIEHKDAWVCAVDLPGVPLDQIDVQIKGDALAVSAERRKSESKEAGRYAHAERSFGKFHRVFTLPADVDPESVTASSHDGVLEIRIARSERAKSRKIAVTSSQAS